MFFMSNREEGLGTRLFTRLIGLNWEKTDAIDLLVHPPETEGWKNSRTATLSKRTCPIEPKEPLPSGPWVLLKQQTSDNAVCPVTLQDTHDLHSMNNIIERMHKL